MSTLMQRLRSAQTSRENGFTFMEVLVAMLIIGIIAAIAVPAWAGHIKSGNDVQVQAEALNAYSAVGSYKYSAGTLPETIAESGMRGTRDATLAIIGNDDDWCIAAFMEGSKYESAEDAYKVADGSGQACELTIPAGTRWESD
ncbi:type II secretion system protein [Citricoccus nitrophenolicus]|uniref:type II secretion system protein n=1 Tax=Citricoccus nitrophenolicus TaxID=863575 RepID=UPI0031E9DEB3